MSQAFAVFLFVLAGLLTAAAQVFLKLGALGKYPGLRQYLNPYVVSGYLLLLLVTSLTVWAYQGVEFKAGPILASISYCFVVLLGWLVLKERLSAKRVGGALLIVLGMVVFMGSQ